MKVNAETFSGSFGNDLVGELFAGAELLDVLHSGGSNVGQRLLCQKRRVWRDEHVGVRLQLLELLVPGPISLTGRQGSPVLEEQRA